MYHNLEFYTSQFVVDILIPFQRNHVKITTSKEVYENGNMPHYVFIMYLYSLCTLIPLLVNGCKMIKKNHNPYKHIPQSLSHINTFK